MRTIAIAKKVIKELLRDKRTLAMMFVAPVFIMWLMNLMFSASTTVNVKLATQDLPTGLVTKMDELDHVDVETYQDLDQAKKALADEKVDAVISYKDGEYQVFSIKHKGDTWGDEWTTEVVGVSRNGRMGLLTAVDGAGQTMK